MFTEGLSDFTSDILSLGIINIPSYTNPLSKLYGLNYFDPLNGNLIRFVQKTQDTSASTSNKPYTDRPVSITILNRNSSIQPITSFLDEAKPIISGKSVSSSYFSPFVTFDNDCVLFYIPWKNQTFIHIIDRVDKIHILSCLFSPNIKDTNAEGYSKKEYSKRDRDISINNIPTLDLDLDLDLDLNNKIIKDSKFCSQFGSSIYKLSQNISINLLNGNIILYNTTNKRYSTFDRKDGNPYDTNKPDTKDNFVENMPFNSWTKRDSSGQLLLVYFAYLQSTVILLIGLTSDKDVNNYTLINCKKFTPEGVDDNGEIIPINQINGYSTTDTTTTDTTTDTTNSKETLEDYYKWYWYWNSPEAGNNNSQNPSFSNDYLLKTQVVPPVCPSLPIYAAAISSVNNAHSNNITPAPSNNTNQGSNNTDDEGVDYRTAICAGEDTLLMRTTDEFNRAVYSKKYFDYPETSGENPNPQPYVKYNYEKCIMQEDDNSPTPMPYTDSDATPQKFKFRTAQNAK